MKLLSQNKFFSWFEKLKFYQIIEVYIIITIILLSPLYFFSSEKKFITPNINIAKLSTSFERIAIQNNLVIIKNITSKDNIYIEIIGEKNNLFEFLNITQKIEKNLDMKKIVFTKLEKDYKIEISYTQTKYNINVIGTYLKNNKLEKNKEVEVKDLKPLNTSTKIDYELKAIIDDFVMINDKWYSIGDNIGIYEIQKNSSNSIVLKNKDDKIILKVYKNVFNK